MLQQISNWNKIWIECKTGTCKHSAATQAAAYRESPPSVVNTGAERHINVANRRALQQTNKQSMQNA